MISYEDYLNLDPFSADRTTKQEELTRVLVSLSCHHEQNCPEYARFLKMSGCNLNAITSYDDLPFLPVRLFKEYELCSCAKGDIVKTMTSSGTTGQQVSKIYLDKITSRNQQKIMTRIVGDFIGSGRFPMIILDTSTVVKNRDMFSARGAGILGFSMFGRDRIYALDQNMELDLEGLRAFLDKHEGEDILLFGFTFMIWQHFYKKLLESGNQIDLSHGHLIHGGGWKKLQQEAVSPAEFKDALNSVCGIDHVHDYYGMVEQTGTIYMQCEFGNLHASRFSDVIVRNPKDWSIAGIGERGLIEVVSSLPYSYPGHVLLTEDEGAVLGEDNCPCGRMGKYFAVYGRVKNAEIRGCSDTYADKLSRETK